MVLTHCVCVLLSRFTHVQLCETLWTAACQAPPSMGSPGKNTGVGCCTLPPAAPPPIGTFPTRDQTCISYLSAIKPASHIYLHWQAGHLPLAPPGKPLTHQKTNNQEENLGENMHLGAQKGILYGKHRNESESSV